MKPRNIIPILLSLFAFFVPSCQVLYAQEPSVVTDGNINKQYEKVMKAFRKSQGLKNAHILQAPDGFMYIEAYEPGYAYAQLNGSLIREKDYHDKLYYIPAFEEGMNDKKFPTWHPASKAVFIDDKYIISPDGTIIIDAKKQFGENSFISGNYKYFYEDKQYFEYFLKVRKGEKELLFTLDGKQLCPFAYDLYDVHHDGDMDWCETTNIVDGIHIHGMFNLKNPADSIPCKYPDVRYHTPSIYNPNDSSYWEVRIDEFSYEYKKYVSGNNDKISFRDEGEKLYVAGKHEDVIKFYQNEGIDKPWAKFFTGSSLRNLAWDDLVKVSVVVKEGRDGAISFGFKAGLGGDKYTPGYLDQNCSQIIKRFELAKQMLLQYKESEGAEERYLPHANVEISWIERDIEELTKLKPSYEAKVAQIQREDAAAMRAEQQRAQEKAQFWGAVLGVFANALSNAISGGNNRSSSYVPSSTYSGSSSNSTASSSYSSSSSSDSGDTAGKAKSGSRKRELQRHIHTYQGLLRDAEAVEAKCRAEKSNYLGQAIRDVNKYKNKLQELQNELNGL